MKVTDKSGLSLELSDNDFTAKIVSSPNAEGSILIPHLITHRSHDYIITSISEKSFENNKKIKSIEFPPDSELRSICNEAFSSSSLESLSIPSKLQELKEGWCNGASSLVHISISPENKYYKIKDDKFIISKSDQKQQEFDLLVFGCRDIEVAIIPSSIKRICPFAFAECYHLSSVKFPFDSCLQTIDRYSFAETSITTVLIPSSLTKICERSFYCCYFLKMVSLDEDSELTCIEKEAFNGTVIDNLFIPSKVKELKDGWCCGTSKLNKVAVSPENKIYKYIDDKFIIGKNQEDRKSVV